MTKDDFWRKYFAVYDVLNELRPYQDLLGETGSGTVFIGN